jgi:CP family cyanate transporter-like MFS transporter
MQDDLGMSHAAAGLLATIPVACMGLFALPAAAASARWGTRRAIAACLAMIATAGLLRAAAPGALVVLALTVPIGIGMGACGALLPVAVKERFAGRAAVATGAYTTGIQVGSVSSTLVVVALAGAGSWRLSLVVLSLSAVAVTLAWLALDHDGGAAPPPRPGRSELRAVLRSRAVWVLVAIFALMGMVYYGLIAWLPDAYGERGWTERSAGGLIAALSFAQIPGALGGAWLGRRVPDRRVLLGTAAAVLAAGAIGVAFLPSVAYAGAVLAGLGMGLLFTGVLTVPLDLGATPTEAGAIAGVMLTGGYAAAACAPVILGAVRDATGSFTGVLDAVAATGVAVFAVCLLLPRGTHSPASSDPIRSSPASSSSGAVP